MTKRNQIKGRAIRGGAMQRTGQYAQAGSRPVGGEWIRRGTDNLQMARRGGIGSRRKKQGEERHLP